MTKIKIILSTVTAVAVVGGASALNVKKTASLTLYSLRAGDFVAKPNPTDAQNCIETIATDGIFMPSHASLSYYYVTASVPIHGINPCHYSYYLTKE